MWRRADLAAGLVFEHRRPKRTVQINGDLCLNCPSDVHIVVKLDRLGRNRRDVLNLVHELDEQGASLRVLEFAIDTRRAYGPHGPGRAEHGRQSRTKLAERLPQAQMGGFAVCVLRHSQSNPELRFFVGR